MYRALDRLRYHFGAGINAEEYKDFPNRYWDGEIHRVVWCILYLWKEYENTDDENQEW